MSNFTTQNDIEAICRRFGIVIDFVVAELGIVVIGIKKFEKFDLFDIRLKRTIKELLNYGTIGVRYIFVKSIEVRNE